jgi:hypothetical protein
MMGWRVVVPMAVCPLGHHIMVMQVVPVVMGVGMLMVKCLVRMGMTMRLREVQHHTQQHQGSASHHHPTA